MDAIRHVPSPGLLRRGLAATCVALVLLLGVFAASPTLHERLHQDNDPAVPDQCGVVLFVTGVAVPVPLHVAPPVPAEWISPLPVQWITVRLDPPRYLLRPERGPPLA